MYILFKYSKLYVNDNRCVFNRVMISLFYKVEYRHNLTWFHEVCGDEQKVSLQNKWPGLQITGRVAIGQVIRDLKKNVFYDASTVTLLL